MIERSHLRALQLAAQRAQRAVSTGVFDEAQIATRQMSAIIELEQSRREIFSRYGVSDLQEGIRQTHPKETTAIEIFEGPIGEAINRKKAKKLIDHQLMRSGLPPNRVQTALLNLISDPQAQLTPDVFRDFTYSESVRMFRLSAGWSINDLADRTGLNYTFFSLVENNKRIPRTATVNSIVKGFGWSENDWQAIILVEKANEQITSTRPS